jgi:predicted RNA-binding Zn-ribbon protein involved in translation (DUF1610 family)
VKIITLGKIPEHRIFALEHRCPDCSTVYRLEAGDFYALQQINYRYLVKTQCPICGRSVSTRLAPGAPAVAKEEEAVP